VLVRAGDRVIVWEQGPELRMEIAAVALEYGHAGQLIHLRRKGFRQGQSLTLTGVVRGPSSVELAP
jgi:flagella basal body P-ring formation protein FlgA